MKYFSTDPLHYHPSAKTNPRHRYSRSTTQVALKDHLKRLSESEALVKTSRLLRRWTSQRTENIPAKCKPRPKPHRSCLGAAPTQSNHQLTRLFKNESAFIKIIRFEDAILGFQERVVFPGQAVFLNLEDQALVRVKSSEHVTNINVDTIHSYQLPLADFEHDSNSDSV